MQYWRCKCGDSTSMGSMGPARCTTCSKCGSDLAQAPSLHREPLPHVFDLPFPVETDEGQKTISRCKYCYRSRGEISKREVKTLEEA